MQEARKKAEAEKIHIMEELWQARFGCHVMGFCSCPFFLNFICASILSCEPSHPCWTNCLTGGREAAPWAAWPMQQGTSGDQSFQILKRSCDKACGQQFSVEFKSSPFWKSCWWPDACVYLTTLSHFPSHFNLGRPPSAPTAAMAAQGKHLEGPYRPSGDGEVLHQGPPPGSWSATNIDFQNTALFQKPAAPTVWRTPLLSSYSHVSFTFSLRPEGSELSSVVIHCENHFGWHMFKYRFQTCVTVELRIIKKCPTTPLSGKVWGVLEKQGGKRSGLQQNHPGQNQQVPCWAQLIPLCHKKRNLPAQNTK